MPAADRPALLQFWGKTDKSGTMHAPGHEFHPLPYHLLDVAACADAAEIVSRNLRRLRWRPLLIGCFTPSARERPDAHPPVAGG